MRKSSTPPALGQRLSDEEERIKAQIKGMEPGPQRDLLRRKLQGLEAAARLDRWMASKELEPPK
jgi:hypothetical protein